MTQQLADARSAVERSMEQLDAARGNLQTIWTTSRRASSCSISRA
jgi:hypothetical protein